MRGLWKCFTIIIFTLNFFLTAPMISKKEVRASILPSGKIPVSVITAEAEQVENNLINAAADKCFLDTSCTATQRTIAQIPDDKGPEFFMTNLVEPERVKKHNANTIRRDKTESDKSETSGRSSAGSNLQAFTHVIGSHLGVVTRPVTGVKRLFFLIYDTLKDTIGWPAISATASRSISESPPSSTMDLEAWELRLDEMTGSETSYGRLNFLVDGDEFFPRFLEAVGDAKRSVNIRSYIFDNDDFAINIADTLKERSGDIDIKILLDGWGTIAATGVTPETLPADYEPPSSVRSYLTTGSRVRVRQQFNPWFTGDHSKTVIVDGEKAFVGGMNIGREYRYEWHDLMVEVDGQVVGDINHGFGKAWAAGGVLGDVESFFHSLRKRKKKDPSQGYPVRLLYTRPGDSEIRNTQLEAIRRSSSYIYLENPYFTDDRVLDELVRASRRGVDVRVVLPKDSHNRVIDRSNVLAANKMLQNGIRVYFLPRMSHVKAAVYDGWACFGSANFDKLSLRVNYEVNLATSHEPAVKELINSLFIPDIRASHELKEELPVRAGDFLLELVADQL